MHFVGPDQLHGFQERVTTDIYPSDFGWTPDWLVEGHQLPPSGMSMRSVVEAGVSERSMQIDYDEEACYQAEVKLWEYARSPDKAPFILAVYFTPPHNPFTTQSLYWDMYDHDKIKLAENAYQPLNSPDIATEAQHNSAELRKNYLGIPAEGLFDESLSKDLIHGYYASVSYMDAMIGKLIEGLEEAGLRDNTTIILWSDHGYFLGEHGFWCKHSTFYEAVQIPLIISSPKYSAKDNSDSFTELVDIYPTLCELAGIIPPNYLQGKSLTPVLKNPETILKDEIYTRYKQGEAVIDKNYSYTEFVVAEKYLGNMLYDLNEDLEQNSDVSKLCLLYTSDAADE